MDCENEVCRHLYGQNLYALSPSENVLSFQILLPQSSSSPTLLSPRLEALLFIILTVLQHIGPFTIFLAVL